MLTQISQDIWAKAAAAKAYARSWLVAVVVEGFYFIYMQIGEEKRTKCLDCLPKIAYKVVLSSHNSSQLLTCL